MSSQLQEMNFKVNSPLEAGLTEDEGFHHEFFAGLQEVASNVKSFLMAGDSNASEKEFGSLKLFDSKLKPDPIRAAAEEVVLGGWNQEDIARLSKEREQYADKFKWWAAGAGIGIQPPEPGPMMQRLEKEINQTVSNAQRLVEGDFDMDGLQKEREEYDRALKRRSLQIGIGIAWPEPGRLMKEYERQVIRRINQQQP